MGNNVLLHVQGMLHGIICSQVFLKQTMNFLFFHYFVCMHIP